MAFREMNQPQLGNGKAIASCIIDRRLQRPIRKGLALYDHIRKSHATAVHGVLAALPDCVNLRPLLFSNFE